MAGQVKKIGDFTFKSVSGAAAEVLRRTLCMYVKDYVEVQPSGAVFPNYLEDWCLKYHEFPVQKDDVWVVTYPKAGTTWTQELVWCLMFDMDSEEAKLELMKRFPFFEFDSLVDSSLEVPGMRADDPMKPGNTWKILQTLKSPRTIKSHLPVALLPKQLWTAHPKIIYVCRDPRDVCVSYYFHCIKLEGYTGNFDEFVKIFIGDMITYSPIWPHILDFWRRRHQSNILFIRFEDMKEDLPAVVMKVAKFLGKAVTEEEVERLADHCSFGSMSKNLAANNETFVEAPTEAAKGIKFMRKGMVGDWKNHLTKEQQKAFKTWTMKYLEGSDFPFYRDYDDV
ncbi:luciferin sulfotransferase [Penaeus vannamei]|uniref:luciferin sulfotransferase n=1 Tax=Penaeus vannamei TaxID=6689 RepID=UPI000F676D45|nr:sulfotransferase 1 family member D1-like [Penaeus vannamei]